MSASTSTAAFEAARLTSVAGRVVIVSGSTSGIGRAIAKHFLAVGARVVVNGRTLERTEAVARELAKEVHVDESNVFPIAADLSTAEGAASFVRQVRENGLVPDVLVLAAGFYRVVDFFESTEEDWMRYHNANVMSTVRLCQAFLKGMLERNSGRVIIIASEAAVKPLPHMLPYSASKASQVCIARGLAELTKGTKVTVNSVLVGPTRTEGVMDYFASMAERAGEADADAVIKSYFEKEEPTSLVQRLIKVEEVAAVVAFLASDGAAAINGAAQHCDGGLVRHT